MAVKETKMSRAIMPGQTNMRGTLYGGMLMDWMDEIAGIVAKRYAGGELATVAVEKIQFLAPIPVGAFVDVIGKVVHVGNTSLRIQVNVNMDVENEEDKMVGAAEFVYVAIDENHRPRPIGKKE